MTKSSFINLTANQGQSDALDSFLRAGGDMVAELEPGTKNWYALRREDSHGGYAIFDIFADQASREAHFGGKVAAALADNAPTLLDGGWDGVLANVRNYAVIAKKLPAARAAVSKAAAVVFEAAEGQADALRAFMLAGRDLVAESEPQTLYWFALESEDHPGTFAIVDLFADEAGRAAHFGGQVAAALQQNAAKLIAGGWDEGVLANVVYFDVRRAPQR